SLIQAILLVHNTMVERFMLLSLWILLDSNLLALPVLAVVQNEVQFYLYTRTTLQDPEELQVNDDSLLNNSKINFSKPTRIFCHGFTESYTAEVSQSVMKAYLKYEDCNVILINAQIPFARNYLVAANNVLGVGKYSAEFVDYLVSKGMPLSSLELIGMSLGSQTMGIVGASVKSGRIPKIMAYEPAGPLFHTRPESARLDKSDADFVIVIHTNWGFNGFFFPCGHVDFWINDSPLFQPGCSLWACASRRPSDMINELCKKIFCSHFFSHRLATYAINNQTAFPARKCTSFTSYKNGYCDKNDLQFVGDQVYSKTTLQDPEELQVNNDSLLNNSKINFSKPTKIFCHGFTESYTAEVSQSVMKAYLKYEDCNVILINAQIPFARNYLLAAYNILGVGKYSAEFVDYLVSKGMPLSSLELIGMSLGSQTMGIVGASVKSGRVPKIMAYDPAGPLFHIRPESARLDKSDADFVIVIHTNWGFNGFFFPCGHVDFWINDSPLFQPGCSLWACASRRPTDIINELFFCSHFFSHRLATYAINNQTAFLARKCTSFTSYKNGDCDKNDLQFVGDQVYSK
ncbi:unnamed protein product, partial [Brassicogethes aeneus]